MTWEGLWSSARVVLGLTSEEFWGLCPRQLVALGRARQAENVRLEFGPAVVASVLTMGKKSPFEFMPSMMGKKPVERKQNWQQHMAVIKQMHTALTGEEVTDGP